MTELLPLSVHGAETSRRGKRLIGPIDLTLVQDGTSVVLGPNGSGKTTLLRLMHGAARLTKGSIRWSCSTDFARRAQAFVFQRPVMLRRNVRENLIYPLIARGDDRKQSNIKAQEWAGRVDLGDMLERQATVLSGGEQQKLAIARALIVEPKLVFLDEPTANLDGRATREIEEILRSAQEGGTKIVLSTHDMGQARRLASDVVFLLNGKVHEIGPARAFFENAQTAQARAFLQGDIVD